MAVGPLIPALSIGTAIFGAFTNAAAARNQNQAVQASLQSQREALRVRQQQLSSQAGIEKQKRINEANQIQGRLRVAAGEAGVGLGGSAAALARQAEFDKAVNLSIIDANFQSRIALGQAQFRSTAAQTISQQRNPLLSAFSGAVSGLETGLRIGRTAEDIRLLQPEE